MEPLTGVWVDLLTPLRPDGGIDHARWVSHVQSLRSRGARNFALFGHAGEGAAFAAREKLTALAHLVQAGLEADRAMLGIQNAALPEAMALIRAAHEIGVRRFLVAPPLYIHPVQQSGMSRYFSELLQDVGRPDARLYVHLLEQPGPSEIPDAALADMHRVQPQGVAGMVYQGRNLDRVRDYIEAFGESGSVLPSFEGHMRILGTAGVLSVQANLVPQVVREVLEGAWSGSKRQIAGMKIHQPDERLQSWIALMGNWPAAVFYKYLLALFYRQPEWALVRAPHTPLSHVMCSLLEKAFHDAPILPEE